MVFSIAMEVDEDTSSDLLDSPRVIREGVLPSEDYMESKRDR